MGYVSIEQRRKKIKAIIGTVVCCVLVVTAVVLAVKVMVDRGLFGNGGEKNPNPSLTATEAPEEGTQNPSEPTKEPEPFQYINEAGGNILSRFNPPEGYERVTVEPGSFGEYLQTYPLKDYGAKAYYYDETRGRGEELVYSEEASTVGVFQQKDKLTRWQQCADTAIMLYAEYLYEKGQYDAISFHFSNGFVCDYASWAKGLRVNISGNKTEWVDKTADGSAKAGDYSYDTFLKYLDLIYQYANTNSLASEMKKVSRSELMPGDLLIATLSELKAAAAEISDQLAESVSYGHAIMIVDVAVNAEGDKVYLIAEGNTPATEPAVIEPPGSATGVWVHFDADGRFVKSDSGIRWKSDWGYRFE